MRILPLLAGAVLASACLPLAAQTMKPGLWEIHNKTNGGGANDPKAELHKQMVASTKLIETLASQNTLLVSRVEANRVLVRWLVAVVMVLTVAVLALWWGRAG